MSLQLKAKARLLKKDSLEEEFCAKIATFLSAFRIVQKSIPLHV